METLFLLAVATVVIVLIFDYTNGFHDAANIVATVIASRAMTPAQAVIIVGVFEFLGPLLGGTAVANTIGKFITLDGVAPVLGEGVVMYPNTAIIGRCQVGDGTVLAQGVSLINADTPGHCTVFGAVGGVLCKPTRHDALADIFRR